MKSIHRKVALLAAIAVAGLGVSPTPTTATVDDCTTITTEQIEVVSKLNAGYKTPDSNWRGHNASPTTKQKAGGALATSQTYTSAISTTLSTSTTATVGLGIDIIEASLSATLGASVTADIEKSVTVASNTIRSAVIPPQTYFAWGFPKFKYSMKQYWFNARCVKYKNSNKTILGTNSFEMVVYGRDLTFLTSATPIPGLE
jgi:hypothetical protein